MCVCVYHGALRLRPPRKRHFSQHIVTRITIDCTCVYIITHLWWGGATDRRPPPTGPPPDATTHLDDAHPLRDAGDDLALKLDRRDDLREHHLGTYTMRHTHRRDESRRETTVVWRVRSGRLTHYEKATAVA